MKRWIHASEEDRIFIVEYISKADDRSCKDRIHAKNAKEAEKKVKSRAFRILDVYEEK